MAESGVAVMAAVAGTLPAALGEERPSYAVSAPVNPDRPEPNTQEFDAAEEICRFAEPLLVPAASRRLRPS